MKKIIITAIIATVVADLTYRGYVAASGNYSLITPSGIERPTGKLKFSEIEWRPVSFNNNIELPFVGDSIVVASRDNDLMWSYHPFDKDGILNQDAFGLEGKEYLAFIPEELRASYKKMKPTERIVARCPRGMGTVSLWREVVAGNVKLPAPDGHGGYTYDKR